MASVEWVGGRAGWEVGVTQPREGLLGERWATSSSLTTELHAVEINLNNQTRLMHIVWSICRISCPGALNEVELAFAAPARFDNGVTAPPARLSPKSKTTDWRWRRDETKRVIYATMYFDSGTTERTSTPPVVAEARGESSRRLKMGILPCPKWTPVHGPRSCRRAGSEQRTEPELWPVLLPATPSSLYHKWIPEPKAPAVTRPPNSFRGVFCST